MQTLYALTSCLVVFVFFCASGAGAKSIRPTVAVISAKSAATKPAWCSVKDCLATVTAGATPYSFAVQSRAYLAASKAATNLADKRRCHFHACDLLSFPATLTASMSDQPPGKVAPELPNTRHPARLSLGEAWQLLRLTAVEWWNDDAFRLAASLAFYTIFSVAPLLLIAVLIASLFFTRQAAAHRIEDELQTLVGDQGAQALRQIIEATQGLGSSAWAIVAGVVTVVIGSTAVFGELQAALNKLWDVEVKVKRGLVWRLIADRARSFALVLGVGFLLLVSLVISGTLDALQDYLATQMPRVPWLWKASNFLTSFVVAALLFALIYRFLPDVRLHWKDVWRGALVTALLFVVGKSLIGVYLGHAVVAGAYGAAGSFVVLLFWIYYSSLICFFGAEFTQVYTRRHGAGIQPEAYAQRVGRKPDQI